MSRVRIFHYIEPLDAFVVTDEYRRIAEQLGLTEWHPAVWIGRLFTMDNDFGEHWFDNWDERQALEAQAAEMGIDSTDLMILVPERLANGNDGPCHPPELRKRFWTDVLKSLELSFDLLFEEARFLNDRIKEILPDEVIEDLEERIVKIQATLGKGKAGEEILALQPSSILQERVTELLAKAKLHPLSDQEEAELDGYFRLEHLVRLAKGQAQAVS